MRCIRPIFVKKVDQYVRCGRCLGCKIKFRNAWASRIYFEWCEYQQKNPFLMPSFVTWTYDPETVSYTASGLPTLEKATFQQWLRNQYKRTGPFRHFSVGEYGSGKKKRPHYHSILFPSYIGQERDLGRAWYKSFGYCKVEPARFGGCQYLTKYATKWAVNPDRDPEDDRESEFRSSSRRPPLGQTFCLNLLETLGGSGKDFWLNTVGDVPKCVRAGGRIWPIPDIMILKMRLKYDIPTTQQSRIKRCPTHVKYINHEELKWEPKEAEIEEAAWKERTRQIQHRSRGRPM